MSAFNAEDHDRNADEDHNGREADDNPFHIAAFGKPLCVADSRERYLYERACGDRKPDRNQGAYRCAVHNDTKSATSVQAQPQQALPRRSNVYP
jgi:hypothetical protein